MELRADMEANEVVEIALLPRLSASLRYMTPRGNIRAIGTRLNQLE